MTFLRTFFNQTFRQKNQATHLHPFRNNVADHLSPFTHRIHFPKQDGPANAGQDDEEQQRVSLQVVQHRIVEMAKHAPASGGLHFQQKFRAQNKDDRAAPVGNRVAEERAEMRGWV